MSFDPWISEWGNPPLIPRKFELHESAAQVSRNCYEVSAPEYIGCKKRTQGTETSKYLQERTSKRDSASSGERTRTRPVAMMNKVERSGKFGLSG